MPYFGAKKYYLIFFSLFPPLFLIAECPNYNQPVGCGWMVLAQIKVEQLSCFAFRFLADPAPVKDNMICPTPVEDVIYMFHPLAVESSFGFTS